MNEFDVIHRYFQPLAAESDTGLGLLDDAAVWTPPDGRQTVLTKDLIVAGVHFFPDDDPENVARKLLRTNLSDLAAMGAKPEGYLLGLCLTDETDSEWVRRFAEGLAADQALFDILLFGGDTVSGAPGLTLSLTAIGTVELGKALKRSGAQVGDCVYVTGTLGDAALGLRALRGELDRDEYLIGRYHLPEPRVGVGRFLAEVATACTDISDGLISDLGHICSASGVAASISIEELPCSVEADRLIEKDHRLMDLLLAGGDDYELVFTASDNSGAAIDRVAKQTGVPIAQIGQVLAGRGVAVLNGHGVPMEIDLKGYQHSI